MHEPAYQPSHLAYILSRAGPLPALHPEDGAKIKPCTIYVAPPDHHLLIDDGYLVVERGPKENGVRPSIAALFRSAAYSYRPNAIGVILSGALHDGASGLWSIKCLGGTAIVQDPYEAEYASMPSSALEYVEVDYEVRSREIGALLTRLAHEQPEEEIRAGNYLGENFETRIAKEVQILTGTNLS